MYSENLYTPEELGEKLKISKYTVYEMIKRGEIPAYKIGRSIRVSQSQLDLFLARTNGLNNNYEGFVVEENEKTYVEVEGAKIFVNTELRDRVKILIRSEDIILAPNIFPNSARNVFKGIVTDLREENGGVKVFVASRIPLVSFITKDALMDLDIRIGMDLYCIFKTMAVRVYK